MDKKYIFDFKPTIILDSSKNMVAEIESKIRKKESLKEEEIKFFLDNLCFQIRKLINPKMDKFDYKCDLAQAMAYHYLRKLNCVVYPAMTQNVIVKDIVGHSFSVAQFYVENEWKYYIIDPTYIQFCKEEKCSLNNFLISSQYPERILLTPDPGYFILENDWKKMTEFINHGYMECTDETARIYGDSFLNTKQGTLKSNLKFQSILGSTYRRSFLKANEPISKNESELKALGCFVEPIKIEEIKNIKVS